MQYEWKGHIKAIQNWNCMWVPNAMSLRQTFATRLIICNFPGNFYCWKNAWNHSEIVTGYYFYVQHKSRRKNNQNFKLPFFKINLFKLNIFIHSNRFMSHKRNLFGLLSSRNKKKTHTDQSIQLGWEVLLSHWRHCK